jgi:hypothetical protein
MTPEQLRDFVIFRGQALREQLTNRLDFLRGIEDRDQLKKVIDAIEGGVNRQAKARLYEGETAVPDRPR